MWYIMKRQNKIGCKVEIAVPGNAIYQKRVRMDNVLQIAYINNVTLGWDIKYASQ